MKRNLLPCWISRTRNILILIFAGVICNMTFAKEVPLRFTSLQETVSFIATCLDTNDSAALYAACLKGKRSDNVFSVLQYVHKKTPLTTLYKGREFPSKGTIYKLGGHNRELGHIHIDFVKRGKHWFIDSIWICR